MLRHTIMLRDRITTNNKTGRFSLHPFLNISFDSGTNDWVQIVQRATSFCLYDVYYEFPSWCVRGSLLLSITLTLPRLYNCARGFLISTLVAAFQTSATRRRRPNGFIFRQNVEECRWRILVVLVVSSFFFSFFFFFFRADRTVLARKGLRLLCLRPHLLHDGYV